jgi:hypothetical protein
MSKHAPRHARLREQIRMLSTRTRLLVGVATLGLSAVLLTTTASGAETVSYDSGDTVFDLSPAGETPNAGAHLAVGSIDLPPGNWSVESSATLFVPDVGRETKNSQGCGLYSYDGQFAGAGGSSSGWTPVDGGKEKVLNLITHPWSSDPDYDPAIEFTVPDEFEGGVLVELVCFIDQSHSGATFEDRVGMAAYDVSIVATPVYENFGQEVKADVSDGGPPKHAPAKGLNK